MSKRHGSELNHDNWDKEEDVEEAGIFQPLSESQMQNRVIKRAKRSLNSGDGESGASRSPFSAFSGFSRGTSQPAFKFQLQSPKPDATISINPELSDKEPQNGCSTSFGMPSTSKVSSSSKPALPPEEAKQNRDLEFFRQLRSLNESMVQWIRSHIEKNPFCDFTPVFNDYKNHLQKLDRMYPAPKTAEIKAFPPVEASKNSQFKLPMPVASNQPGDGSDNKIKFFKLGSTSGTPARKKSNTDDEMSYGAGFASNTTNTSTFSFGIKDSPTATSTGSKYGPTSSHSSDKSDDKGDTSEKSTGALFSFGLKKNSDDENKESSSSAGSEVKPFSFGLPTVIPNSGNEQKDEEYVPPKNEFSKVTEEDAIYSKRCKLFFQKDGSYIDKGVGTLYLKPMEEKTQLLIRADTNLGNILLNIMVSSSLPVERSGKNNVLLVCVPNPPVDAKAKDSKTPVPLLIRVKTSDDADELLEKLNECKS